MTTFKSTITRLRTHAWWLALAVLALAVAACNNGGGGTGY